MSQTVDLNQVEPSTTSPNPSPKPYANWGRMLSTNKAGRVGCQGLQCELNLRARGGLNFQASHVWAKSLGDVGGDAPTSFNPEIIYGTPVANRFNLAANRGNMSATRRHRFLLSALYELPVGKNRKYFSGMNRIVDAVAGGWSLSTVSLWETGPYLTPPTSNSFIPGTLILSYRGAAQRPDCIGNPNSPNPAAGPMFNINSFPPLATPSPGPPVRPVGHSGVWVLSVPGTSTLA